jgi:HAD superfamily hydrolase (TIGR01509 family)
MRRNLAALLLDMDGSLLDTEPLHCEAHRRFLEKKGFNVPFSAIVDNIGKSDRAFYRRIMADHGISEDVESWLNEKIRILAGIYREGGVKPMPGAVALLDAAASAGIPAMLVTSSQRILAETALEMAGLASRLPARICHDDVVNRKPNPDPYLLAATRLGVPAEHCLVVEDSVYGVTAGVAAGARVIAMRGATPEADVLAAGAERMVDSLTEILPLKHWATVRKAS